MRLTVGPLPPAVYWRRRAVVLGAGLLFLIVLLYSCSEPGGDNTATSARTPTPAPSGSAADPAPSAAAVAPESGAPPASPGGETGAPAGEPVDPAQTTDAPVGPGAPVDDGTCTDAEISVIPVALPATVQRGAVVDLQLKIKNTSRRTCSRDVGADLQELFVKSGADRVWSSDTCGTGKGSDVQSFTPGFERSYQVGWNGKDTTRCAGGVAAGPNPPAGSYQVFGRLGTRLSAPAKLTIVG